LYSGAAFEVTMLQRSGDFTFALLKEPGKESEQTQSTGGWVRTTRLP